MNHRPSRLGAFAVAMSLCGLAQAAYDSERGDRGRAESDRRAAPADHGRDHSAMARERGDRGAGPQHSFHNGDRLSQNYRDTDYVENEWRGHHLSSPPSGYHWVRVGDDDVLAAIATGVILQLMLAH